MATGTITVTAPSEASMTYSIDGVTYTNTTGGVYMLSPNTYIVTAEIQQVVCLEGTNVTINAQPLSPDAPITGTTTQPSCTIPTGSIVLTGLPATGTWTLEPGTITGTGTSRTITGLNPGTYNFTVANASGCISEASADVVIDAAPEAPSAPAAGSVTQPTCTDNTGSVILTGLPATGTWTIEPGTITGTGTSRTINGLNPGTYNFTVANAAGCISEASADVVINAAPEAPSAPAAGSVTQPTCTDNTGSVILTGLPATGTWTIEPGTITGTGTSRTITGLNPGTYNFTVANSAGCISEASADVVIDAAPEAPSAPVAGSVTQPTCTENTGSVILTGLPATGTWTIEPGTITGTGNSRTITGLNPGTYNFTVTNAAGCISASSDNIVINDQPDTPSAPVHTIDCSSGSADITVTSPSGAGFEYSIDVGSYQSGATFNSVANGSHVISVRNAAGCTATGSSFQVNCGCANAPSLNLSATSRSICGTSPVTVSGNTYSNATQVTITENGAGSVNASTAGSSPFSFTYTPAAGDAGNTVIITITTDNPSGAPCEAAVATYSLTVNEEPVA